MTIPGDDPAQPPTGVRSVVATFAAHVLGGAAIGAGPTLLAAAATGYGFLLRRPARAGRLPLPDE